MKDSGSEQSTHSLNARLLRFRSQPGSEDPHALAQDLIAAKRYADARGVTTSAQSPDQEDGALLVLEGRAFLSERDLVRAQASLLRAVRAAPDLAEAYRWLGSVLLKRGDPGRALKTLRRAVELDPRDEEAQKLAVRAEHLCESVGDGAAPPDGTREPALPPSPQPRAARGEPGTSLPRQPQPSAAGRPGRGMEPPVAPKPPGGAPFDYDRGETRPMKGSGEEEPTSHFRRLSGRPDNRAAARAGSGTMPSVAPKPAIPNPPDDPELGRYSAQNITAEQFVSPSLRTAARAPAQAGQPQKPARTLGTPSRSDEPRVRSSDDEAPRQPALDAHRHAARSRPDSANLRAPAAGLGRSRSAVDPGPNVARQRTASPAPDQQPPAASPPVRTPPLPSSQRTSPSPPPLSAHRTSPTPPKQAALPTWDEQDGVALLDASVPLQTADVVLGSDDAGRPADADQALEIVRRYGLFEEPRGASPQWAAASEVEPKGTRVRNALIGLWVFTLLASAGGWFGWEAFVEQRHAKAAAWVRDARGLMLRGDHAALVDAERLLRLAREQHPASPEIPLESLILQVERVMEDGERDLAALKIALGRAPVTTDGKSAQATGSAVVAAFGGDRAMRDKLLDEALSTAANDPRRMHLLGRLEERLGRAEARDHIERASQAEPKLVPARLALAAIAFDAGERSDAAARVEAVLAEHKEHLRAILLRTFIRADDDEPAQLVAALNGLGEAMKLAGPVDQLLFELTQARVSRRQGKLDAAAASVERAAATTVDDPRFLAWVAREALALNKPALAQQAAGRALSVAPDVAPYRRLLARVLIERADGARARELLEKLPAEDLEAQIMKAQAALLEDDAAALRAGLDALATAPAGKTESAVLIGALKVRLESKLSPGKSVVDKAKALVRSAPGDPEALLALAEAGLAAHDPATASGALKQRFAVAPDDPNAHYLNGRARRMAADAEGAEASFRKALTLSPGQTDSLVALGGLLLDQGKYEEADAVFQELASRGGSAIQGRLGRVEALVGLGKVADAQVQLDAVPETQHGGAAYRSAAARVALARGKPGEALALLRQSVDAQGDKPALHALYGDALLAAEQLESAGDAYDKALALDSGLPEALLGRAEVLIRSNRSKDAVPVLESAKSALADRIRPPALRAQRSMLLGRAYLARNKRGDDALAEQALRDAVKQSGAPAVAHYWLAEALGGKSNPDARSEYQRYLELAPSGKYADRARRALGP